MPKDGGPINSGIGASTKRREGIRFLTGQGVHTDDPALAGQTCAVFARSSVASGRIVSIDTAATLGIPGVLAMFTGEDFENVGGNTEGWPINSRDGTAMREPKRPVLADGKLRHVGDADAAVVAETCAQAKDAVEQLAADKVIEELPAIVDMAAAVANPDNRVHDEIPDSLCFERDWGEDNRAAVDAAIKAAPHVTTLPLVSNRKVPDAMEPRADDLRSFSLDYCCIPRCAHSPLGVTGCGEAGTIGAPPAVVNAVIDVLHRTGHTQVTHIDMPLTPTRVWSASNTK